MPPDTCRAGFTKRRNTLYPKIKATTIARLAKGKFAKDIVILDIKKLSSVSDYVLLCSADSERQVSAIAEGVRVGLNEKGVTPLGIEGVREGRWALIDYGDVVVHIFTVERRAHYDLDGLWADAERTEVADKPPARSRKTARSRGL